MANLPSGNTKRFKSLLEAAVDYAVPGVSSRDLVLGRSVAADWIKDYRLTVLGPCVGDDQAFSDARLKRDVRRIGTTVFGLPLYQFKYIGNPETYEGVIAQEVLLVMPGAVSVGVDGYYRVNYSALGARMRRVSYPN